jgi:hypothetical protein
MRERESAGGGRLFLFAGGCDVFRQRGMVQVEKHRVFYED